MTKDQVLLEQAYKKVLESNSEMEELSKLHPIDVLPHQEPMDLEDEEEPKMQFSAIIDDLSKSIPSENLINRLKMLPKFEVQTLIDELNQLGDEDERNWMLKDNLIKALFVVKDYEF